MKQAGIALAFAALLVNAPRLVQIFLRVDGITMGDWEAPVLGLTGAAAGIVLSGGQMYIAHALPSVRERFPATKGTVLFIVLLSMWLSMLGFSVVLISPMLVAGIRIEPLMSTVLHDGAEWVWSIVAVTSVEVLAAGTMLVHAITDEPTPKNKGGQKRGTGGTVKGEIQDGTRQPDVKIETPNALPASGGLDTKEEKVSMLLRYYRMYPRATVREASGGTGIARSTVSNYLSELRDKGVIVLTKDGVQVVEVGQ